MSRYRLSMLVEVYSEIHEDNMNFLNTFHLGTWTNSVRTPPLLLLGAPAELTE